MKRLWTLLVVAFVAVALAIPATAGASERAIVENPALECDGITYDASNPDHVLVPDPNGFQGFIDAGETAIVVLSGENQVLFTNYIGDSAPGGVLYGNWNGSVKVIGTVFPDVICSGPNDPSGGIGNNPDEVMAKGGNDRIFGEGGIDELHGQGGDDFIDAGVAEDIPQYPDFAAPAGVTNAADDGADDLRGGNGNDTIIGGPLGDELRGGKGDDSLTGGLGADSLWGGPGADMLYGLGADFDDETVADEDVPVGGTNVRLVGGPGDDMIEAGDSGDDVILGGGGNDTINGGVGDDTAKGGPGNDTINGGADDDVLWGNGGDDTIDGGTGEDTLRGNSGNDTLTAGVEDTTTPTADNDTLFGGWGNDLLIANGDAVAAGDTAANAGDTLHGDQGDDLLYGDEGNDTINPDAGADNAWGWDGDDTFNDNTGDDNDEAADNFWGEDGRDTYVGVPLATNALGSCFADAPSTATEVIGEGADDFDYMYFYSVFETAIDDAAVEC